MSTPFFIVLLAFGYLLILFLIAFYADKRAQKGKSIIDNPYAYSLSLAVYCTAWTFYGSVGRAADTGLGFLPIYIGPTLMVVLWYVVLRRMIRISKHQRITSIADFIGSRYGKSTFLAGVVAVIAILGIIPYISLQLKAISSSYLIITGDLVSINESWNQSGSFFLVDTAFYMTIILGVFTILFGARHLDASEKHEGMVAAIAFESIVKLLAFVLAGLFVVFVVYQNPVELFRAAFDRPDLQYLFTIGDSDILKNDWFWLTILSMPAILLLPRQFQTAVVENTQVDHVKSAAWMFPLYLLAINLFVLPIAIAGLMHPSLQGVNADTFVLTIPLIEGHTMLAILVFIGGLSAATSMVIVATIALSTMFSNDLLMPAILRAQRKGFVRIGAPGKLILNVRRAGIFGILLMAYLYFRFIGEDYSLVSIGLVSFAAVAQFAPALFIGMFWYGATRKGALAGIISGFVIWGYTLAIPSIAGVSPMLIDMVENGPFGLALLRPDQLGGITTLSPVALSVFWSLTVNIMVFIIVSRFTNPSSLELSQAALFIDGKTIEETHQTEEKTDTTIAHLKGILERYLGFQKTENLVQDYEKNYKRLPSVHDSAPTYFIQFVEKELAGAIGSASARLVMNLEVRRSSMSLTEVRSILDETSEVLKYSRMLEEKSIKLEQTSKELQVANEQLRQLDEMKDEFVATVTHELKTPLTSIRALTEIMRDTQTIEPEQRLKFLKIIADETERLTRLINQLLDTQKANTGNLEITKEEVSILDIVSDALTAMDQIFKENSVDVVTTSNEELPLVMADKDRIKQVILNLLSNAVRYGSEVDATIEIRTYVKDSSIFVDIIDNGPGIQKEEQDKIFEPFVQTGEVGKRKAGTGLGLSISRKIMKMHGGDLTVKSMPGEGATFTAVLPIR